MATDDEHDVALSLLSTDLELAERIVRELPESVKRFLYSERQAELYGEYIDEVFPAIFKRARIVVVLFRKGWGDVGGTKVEARAIRDRLLNSNQKFLSVIKLDDSELPTWYSETAIFARSAGHAPKVLAGFIVERLRKAGGELPPETLEQRATRIARQKKAEEKRLAFLKSEAVVAAADEEHRRLIVALQDVGTKIQAAVQGNELVLEMRKSRHVVTVSRDQDAARLHPRLNVFGWRPPTLHAYGREVVTHNSQTLGAFKFDLSLGGQHGWRRDVYDGDFLTSTELAEWVANELLSALEEG